MIDYSVEAIALYLAHHLLESGAAGVRPDTLVAVNFNLNEPGVELTFGVFLRRRQMSMKVLVGGRDATLARS